MVLAALAPFQVPRSTFYVGALIGIRASVCSATDQLSSEIPPAGGEES